MQMLSLDCPILPQTTARGLKHKRYLAELHRAQAILSTSPSSYADQAMFSAQPHKIHAVLGAEYTENRCPKVEIQFADMGRDRATNMRDVFQLCEDHFGKMCAFMLLYAAKTPI